MIIDPRNNYRIDEKSDNRNLNEYEEQAKKAYTIVKQKRKVEKIKNDLETYIGKENFRSIKIALKLIEQHQITNAGHHQLKNSNVQHSF